MEKQYLRLADGQTLEGEQIGFAAEVEGEVVFTTGMTGYVESLTDPSFAGQILVFTYPLIGNYGVPKPQMLQSHLLTNFESERIWIKGVIIGHASHSDSHYAAVYSLSEWLKKNKVPAITGIDTRALTLKLREHGVLPGKITSSPSTSRQFLLMNEPVPYVSLTKNVKYLPSKPNGKKIALIDCGVKHAIIRELLRIGYEVTRVPWNKNPLDISTKFNGVVCSNGPGDPKKCQITVSHIRKIIAADIPFLGICLGHQLLSLAIGADTYKLPYGHRGLNQPVQDEESRRAYLTSQNHGYAVSRNTIPKDYEVWFTNLNDGTVEGIRHKHKNIKSVQFHPEGAPGPFDTRDIYQFV